MSNHIDDTLAELMYRQAAATLYYSAAVASRMGLGLSELAALEHLSAGELTPAELAERLFVSRGAITALVDRLERGGYVERVPNPKDRRSVLLRRTPSSAQKMLGQLLPLIGQIDGLDAGLSDEERAAIKGFVRDATQAMVRQARGEGPRYPGRDSPGHGHPDTAP